jgi:hypothetical protein
MARTQRTDDVSGLVTEASWQAQVVAAAEVYDWYIYHNPDSRRSTAGFPDLVLIRPPRVLFMELKRQTGRLSPIQREVIAALEACPGVEVQVARPSDWEQVCSWLA